MSLDLTTTPDEQTVRRQETIRDPKTSEVSHKPSVPPMLTVVKGGWVYKEVQPPPTCKGENVLMSAWKDVARVFKQYASHD